MAMFVLDVDLQERLKAQRRAAGADRLDEVWEGNYMMMPLANNEHQILATLLASVFVEVIDWPRGGVVCVGANVSDRVKHWEYNYRCPDVAVFLKGTQARDCGTHWFGGPDFAVEIISPEDRTYDKLDFYAKVGVRELLIIDRYPWKMGLYRLIKGELQFIGSSRPRAGKALSSKVLPLTFRLRTGTPRPKIEVVQISANKHWLL